MRRAAREFARAEREKKKARPPKPTNTRRSTSTQVKVQRAAIVLFGVAAWFVLAPPSFVEPPPPPPPAEDLIEAGLKLDVATVASAVIAHRRRTGSLPATLEEALTEPERAEGMMYFRLGLELFEISAIRAGTEVSYRSDQSIEVFTQDAIRRLQGVGGN